MDKQPRTFISYSRVDQDFALRLATALKAAGFNIWLDQVDIPTGEPWDDEVEKALVECEIFMILMTATSVASPNVKDEINYAINRKKEIVPILLEKCDVPLRLSRLQYVDLEGRTFVAGVQLVTQRLRDVIADSQVQPYPSGSDLQARIGAQGPSSQQAVREARVPLQRAPAPAGTRTVAGAPAQKKSGSGLVLIVLLVFGFITICSWICIVSDGLASLTGPDYSATSFAAFSFTPTSRPVADISGTYIATASTPCGQLNETFTVSIAQTQQGYTIDWYSTATSALVLSGTGTFDGQIFSVRSSERDVMYTRFTDGTLSGKFNMAGWNSACLPITETLTLVR